MVLHIVRSRLRNIYKAQPVPGIFNGSMVAPHLARLLTGEVDAMSKL